MRSWGWQMRSWCPAVLFLMAASGAARAGPRASTAEDEAAVRKVEEEVVAAFQKNDADALDRLWASDYTFINPVGLVLGKAQRLALFRSGKFRYDSIQVEDLRVRVHGTAALVTYKSTVAAQRGGSKFSGQRWVTTVLVKEGGRWQVIAQQSTPIQTAPEPPRR